MERQQAMVYKNHTASCLPCQNDTATNPQTCVTCEGTAAPPPELVVPLPGRPSPPGTPPAPPDDTEGNEGYYIKGMPSRSVYMHSSLPNTQFFNNNAFAQDSKRDKDFIPDMLSTLSAAYNYC